MKLARRVRVFAASLAALLCLACALPAEGKRRDPLNPLEVDQLREATQDPDKRLKLYLKYARARILAIEQLRGDPKMAPDRGKQVHDLLEDFNVIAEELEDNLDMFHRHREDLRKPLKVAVEAYSEWQVKLRALKENVAADELRQYEFVLATAIDSVNTGADSARQMLNEENQAREGKHKK